MKNYISFDVGGTDVKYAIINEIGDILRKDFYKSPNNLDDFFREIIERTNNCEEKLSGIALSLPGAVDSVNGTIGGSSALDYIHGPNFKEILKEATDLDVEMENDANCAALAEAWLGVAKDKKDILFIVIGTGVGGAVIKDGKIHHGTNLHGGEFGYMISDFVDGKILTLSDTGSTRGLTRRVESRLNLPKDSINGVEVYKMAEENNVVAQEEINYFYKKLAQGIYNLQYSFDPEMIVLGGTISARNDLVECIEEEVELILAELKQAKIKPVIRNCHFRGSANLIGAVKHFLQAPKP